jgi:enoyl-CoA hydratase/carnithine racemase
MELILTGETLSAARALELHLVNRVVAEDAVVEEARKLAEKIVANVPIAVEEARKQAGCAFDYSDAELAEFSLQSLLRLMAT